MGRYAVVKDGKVKNIIVADEQFAKDHVKDPQLDCDAIVNCDEVFVDMYWDYDGQTFSKPIGEKEEESKPDKLELADDFIIIKGAEAPVDGKTGAGEAGPGSLYVQQDKQNPQIYMSKNSKESPVWNPK